MTGVAIARDPFGRADLVRELVPAAERRPCGWCGSAPGRFCYWWSPDGGGRIFRHARPGFCSVSCWRSYNG